MLARTSIKALLYTLLCGSALTPALAIAQDAPPPVATPSAGAQIFTPADFARFAPATALDMLRQVPGFVIRTADQRRGLGEASENVVINGKRISGKSNDAVTTLGRINARDVIRIEIVDGATLDVPGLSGQVANIVTSVDGLSGSFRYDFQARAKRTDPRWLGGEVSITGKSGSLDYTISLANNSRRNGNAGLETVTDGAGNVIDLRDEILFVNEDAPRLAATLKYETPGGGIANLNASVQHFRAAVDEDSWRRFPGTVDRHRDYLETEREWNYEVGGDYEFGLGGGRLKLIGLHRFEHSPYRTRSFFDYSDGRPKTGDLFLRTADEAESIARAEYRWKAGGADWQVSAEGALNTLDNRSELFSMDAAGVLRPVALPDGNAMVKEKRGEVALSYGRPLAPGLTLQTSLGAEYSNITQDGANGLNRTFYRPKGFVSLAWKASPRFDVSAKIEREVGQLNFYDFVASVNLAGDNGNAGNPDLRPPQSWNVEVEANRSFGAWGSLKARVFAKFITDAVAQVPIGATGEAPGNIDSARLFGTVLSGTLNFDPLGWKGAKIDFNLTKRHSRLRDPLTGERRQLSEDLRGEYNINFRHDIPGSPWTWGADYYQWEQTRGYRLNQVSQFLMESGDVGVFVEHKNVLGMTARAGVYNLLGTNERFYRTVHNGRRTDPVAFTEDRSRFFGKVFNLQLRGSF